MHTRFPRELAALPQWVNWRLEPDKKSDRTMKIPYNPHTGYKASPSNPNTWGTLEQALFAKEKYLSAGIGFVFTAESGIIGIDIDNCIADGKPNDIAADILAHLPPTYIEYSPSGKGLHIFLKGKLPSGGNRNSKTGVEMYAKSRYFTMTGKTYEKSSDCIAVGDDAIKYIHGKYVSNQKKTKSQSSYNPLNPLPDEELLILAEKSKDGTVFSELFKGVWKEKYKSQSEADFSFCRKLAFWSGRNEAQMDRLFRRSGLMRDKWDSRHNANGQTYGEQTVQNACNMTDQVYSPPKQKRESEIFEQGGCYYRRKGDKYYQITNFIVEPIEMVVAEDETQLTCVLITESGERFSQSLLSSDFSTLPRLKNVLNKKTIALSFMGGEGDLELFKIYIYQLNWVKKTGKRAMGIFSRDKKLVFVDTNGAVGVGGVRVTDMVQMERFQIAESSILKADFISADGLRQLGEHLFSYNEPAKTIPVLAWSAACFIKPHLKRYEIKFPHIFLIGEQGSGKSSTAERVINPIFSRRRMPAASQVTGFSLMKESASTNVIPQAIDEHKPSKLNRQQIIWLLNHFRDVYDGHEGLRGRADQSVVTYNLIAPLMVVGEESPDEAAVRERAIELLFSKKDILGSDIREHFLWILQNKSLLQSLGRSLLDTALDTSPGEAKTWFDDGKEFFSDELPIRVHDNLCCIYAGLSLTAKLCGRLGLNWDSVFPYDRDACTKHIQFGAQEYLLDGGMYNKSVLDQIFEVMARMKLKPDEDYAFENNGQFLCLSNVYDRYTKYRKDFAVIGETLTFNQFQKQLFKSEFFIEGNKAKRIGGVTKKVWVLDFAKLSRRCDVAGFLRDEPEPLLS